MSIQPWHSSSVGKVHPGTVSRIPAIRSSRSTSRIGKFTIFYQVITAGCRLLLQLNTIHICRSLRLQASKHLKLCYVRLRGKSHLNPSPIRVSFDFFAVTRPSGRINDQAETIAGRSHTGCLHVCRDRVSRIRLYRNFIWCSYLYQSTGAGHDKLTGIMTHISRIRGTGDKFAAAGSSQVSAAAPRSVIPLEVGILNQICRR